MPYEFEYPSPASYSMEYSTFEFDPEQSPESTMRSPVSPKNKAEESKGYESNHVSQPPKADLPKADSPIMNQQEETPFEVE